MNLEYCLPYTDKGRLSWTMPEKKEKKNSGIVETIQKIDLFKGDKETKNANEKIYFNINFPELNQVTEPVEPDPAIPKKENK